MANKFTVGQQPCANYSPKRDGNGYGEWDNVHQCIYCRDDTTVSFCLTCCRDHHANGYETCKRPTMAKSPEECRCDSGALQPEDSCPLHGHL